MNAINANTEYKCLFQQFCEDKNVDLVRLSLHTNVRWSSKGNCLKRSIELFKFLCGILSDKPEMKHLLTVEGKTFEIYLSDNFLKKSIC